MIRVDGSSYSLYLRDWGCYCWWFVVVGSRVVLVGVGRHFRVTFVPILVIAHSFWSSKLLCAFPTLLRRRSLVSGVL